MDLKFSQNQSQNQILAPSMQQSIEVLLLPIGELSTAIEQELQNNPMLEVDESQRKEKQERLEDEVRKRVEEIMRPQEASFFHSPDNEEAPKERPLSCEESLEDSLLKQLHFEVSDPEELAIGEFIIGNINEDGYLTVSCEEIGAALNLEDMKRIEKVLRIVQEFEPAGIASRSLEECLLIQINGRLNGNAFLVQTVICEHMQDLARRKFRSIARQMKVDESEIRKAFEAISQCDPRPARNYRPIRSNIYVKPDITVTRDEEGGMHIRMNAETVPRLMVSSVYKKVLRTNNLTPEEKTFIRERLYNAAQFIRSIRQRGETVTAIARFILEKQQAFFENGHAGLEPMTLKDVAQAIDRNASTVSRAIHSKYMETPKGLYPMKFFFSQGVGHNGGDNGKAVSNRTIKEELRELIAEENPSAPLSDKDIQTHFKQKGLTIARRTISKYRQSLHILPSHLRKK